MASLTPGQFVDVVTRARRAAPADTLAIPLGVALLSDMLTPVLAYRRLVAPDERTAPSFLLESVEGGERQGRYSILGARPAREALARGNSFELVDHAHPERSRASAEADPLDALRALTRGVRFIAPEPGSPLPGCFLGGWVGFAAYDTARYAEPVKLASSPPDDRGLPDLHFGMYDGVVVFDHVRKLVWVVVIAMVEPGDDPADAYALARADLEARIGQVQSSSRALSSGRAAMDPPRGRLGSNMDRAAHRQLVERALGYIRAGDVFQVVLGQRFERVSDSDPFDVYRALRAVNPSPYMVYLQARECILVASSPEILCRVRRETRADGPRLVLTNRPLAGTRRRGRTPEEDSALERELLADEKERAEHIMLVDLGRNDVGVVSRPGSVRLERLMEVERYSHVMHISSTVTGELRDGMDCWDALRATLPVGTISGAPKIRAMQVIDELEPIRRGPYGGGMGAVGLDGQMDIALALRTIVVPTRQPGPPWTYHLQASGGIVADSNVDAEYQETVNKAAGLARAIDLAEQAFGITQGD